MGRVDPRPSWLGDRLFFRPSWPTTCMHLVGAGCLEFVLDRHLYAYFVCVSSEWSDWTVQMNRLARALVSCWCNKYSKTYLKQPLKKDTKIGFQERLSLNAGQKYCRMLHYDLCFVYFRVAAEDRFYCTLISHTGSYIISHYSENIGSTVAQW